MDDESEAESSGDEWDGGDEDANDFVDEDEMSQDNSVTEDEIDAPRSLVVQLRYGKGKKAESVDGNLSASDITNCPSVKTPPYLQESTLTSTSAHSPDQPLLANTLAPSRTDSRDVLPEANPKAPTLSVQPIFNESQAVDASSII
jgi:hypothetical protein